MTTEYWECEDCGWLWPSHIGTPGLDDECDACGGPLVRQEAHE